MSKTKSNLKDVAGNATVADSVEGNCISALKMEGLSEYMKSVLKEDSPRSALMKMLVEDFIDPTDDFCRELIEDHKDILELYKHIGNSMKFEVTNRYGIVLTPRDEKHLGYAIMGEDGIYYILQYISYKTAAMLTGKDSTNVNYHESTVCAKSSISDVKKFVCRAAEEKKEGKTTFTIPVSSNRFLTFYGEDIDALVSQVDEEAEKVIDELSNCKLLNRYLREL